MRIKLQAAIAAIMVAGVPLASGARPVSVATLDSFRIGNSGIQCTAQYDVGNPHLKMMFDRSYKLVCRDAASAVGTVLALRGRSAPPATGSLKCDAAVPISIDGIGSVSGSTCRDAETSLDYRRYQYTRGPTTYIAEGLAGYDSVLRLGLATVVADKPVAGAVEVATTLVSDAASFASVQAGALDAQGARYQAYTRNNGGSFAQAAAFFESLSQRGGEDSAEYVANDGLQQSNLGNFAIAKRLLDRAALLTAKRDGVSQRMVRNFRAIDALNQGNAAGAIEALAAPVIPLRELEDESVRQGEISPGLAALINRENEAIKSLGGVETGLTVQDRAAIMDAQATQLRGIALRQQAKFSEAREALSQSLVETDNVRGGRVVSVNWMRAQTLSELSGVAEAAGDGPAADDYLKEAILLYQVSYPATPALFGAMARRAGFLARTGRADEAVTLFGDVIHQSAGVSDAAGVLRELVRPYFAILAARTDSGSATAFFEASQIAQRPGVAQTQAILARQFSERNDEASALFRLSLARSRDIVRTNAEIAALSAQSDLGEEGKARLAASKQSLALFEREQTALQSKLAAYPRYRATSASDVTLADLQGALSDGEGYYKLTIVGGDVYGQFITRESTKTFHIESSADQLREEVARLRDSIVRDEDGNLITLPFDVQTARALYKTLFGPIEAPFSGTRHLIFEPDGAMLQLPPSVLISDDKGIRAYAKRIAQPDADEFDFTGIAWLGRDHAVSIAVSPRSFVDVRAIGPSHGRRAYLGLGHNAKPVARPVPIADDDCQWPLSVWGRPISPEELNLASEIVGRSNSAVITDGAFTDTGLLDRQDLSDYRVIHFATHGLVTAPRSQCVARPALVTSFGAKNSDGLLSFAEIFDLKLDADVVILSACDTAGTATAAATREAGVATGGNYALDGLVRAFVGAGARSVIASHWPVPDDFDATKRLIGGLFKAKPGTSVGEALRTTQVGLMNDAETSHPFYWAAFVILGDSAKPLLQGKPDVFANSGVAPQH